MADKTIKHFIFSRFFPIQNRIYPYDVLDPDFLSKQIALAKSNVFKSLENQSNKNFDIVIIAHEKVFSNKKYEFIFKEFQEGTTLSLKFIKAKEQSLLVKEAMNEYDFVIYSRMDLDDFIFKDAVEDTQNKVSECENVLAYGYNRGYTYVWGELYPHCWLFSNRGHHSILQSLIWESSFAKNLPFMSIFSGHPKIKLVLKKFLEDNGVEFSESMFQQSKATNAYIYFRHDLSLDQFDKNSRNPIKIPNKPQLTTKDITKKQLEEEFGFHYDLKSIK